MISAPLARVGARVLLLDPHDCVLLIHERVEGDAHWLTPGGGVEPGEDLRAAAIREVFEETSIVIDLEPGAEAVLVTRRDWQWAGVRYDQVDHFFLVRLPGRPAIVPAAPTEMEVQTLLGHAWWSAADLRATADVIVPADLADVLDDLNGASRARG